jgi:hypothetical protein
LLSVFGDKETAVRTGRSITAGDPRCQLGFSQAARDRLLAAQPATVLKALGIHGVGRKTTKTLLGLLRDPCVQTRALTNEELRANDSKAKISAAPSGIRHPRPLWSEEGIDYRAGWSADVTSVWSLCIVAVGQIAKVIGRSKHGDGYR